MERYAMQTIRDPDLRQKVVAMAAAHTRGDIVRIKQLLAECPRLEELVPSGGTWLHNAADYGWLRLVRFWIERGIDVNQDISLRSSKMEGVHTPLHSAETVAVIRLLVSKGAAVSAWNRVNGTPLHCAVYRGNSAAVRTLLELGADPALIDRDGRTPFALAEHLGRDTCIRVLRAARTPLQGHLPTGRKLRKKAPRIDLRQDAKRISLMLERAVRRFRREHPRDVVTAVAIAASGT